MQKNDIDTLSEYYQYELSYLRSSGAEFASRFPKIARRLDLSNKESSDPHVERLIESVAFLTGKLQKQIDDQFPEIAYTLLDVLCKPLVLPTPSCVMINFDIDIARAAKSPGFIIPKNTLLYAISYSGEICTFRTSHNLRLWPAKITSAEFIQKEHIPHDHAEATYYLKIKLQYNRIAGSHTPEKLRIYIHADALLRGKIFASVFSNSGNIILQHNNKFDIVPPILPVGLENDESLLPYPSTVFNGFRLLQEYFSFPEKFFGFDITIPQNTDINGESIFYIPMNFNISMQLSEKNFSLFSVPAINLFPKISEPLRLEYKQIEYRMIPNIRKYHNTEIYTIEKMMASDAANDDEIDIPEFFSCNYNTSTAQLFWQSRRKQSNVNDAIGEDVYVSFIDTNFNPQFPADKIFYAHTLCTNRYLAEQIPVNGLLQMDFSAPVEKIYCHDRPTAQQPSIKKGNILWKLISALSLNSLSFTSESMQKMRTILNVFADITRSSLAGEVDAIVAIDCSIKTKRINGQTWCGFMRGSNVEITFDESISNFGIPLSMIISKFLSSYTSINTFTEIHVKNTSKNGILKKWNQNFGLKNYL